MALTKEDLQAIQALIKSELKAELKAELKPINDRLTAVEDTLQSIKNSQIIVELEYIPKIKAAMEGFSNATDKNKEQDARILTLENKTDNHSNRIWALEQVAQKA